jgi:protein-export membrane protein SecD
MEKAWYWKVALVLVMVIGSVLYLLPTFIPGSLPNWYTDFFSKKINLGLDLQGGIHLVLGVEVEKALEDKADQYAVDFKEAMKEKRISFNKVFRVPEGWDIQIELKDPTDAKKFRKRILEGYYNLKEVDLDEEVEGVIRVTFDEKHVELLRKNARDQSRVTIRNRVDELGVAMPTIAPHGEAGILVQLPGMFDPERAKKLLGRTAQLEFKMVDDKGDFLKKLKDSLPEGIASEYYTYSGPDDEPVTETYLTSKGKGNDGKNRLLDFFNNVVEIEAFLNEKNVKPEVTEEIVKLASGGLTEIERRKILNLARPFLAKAGDTPAPEAKADDKEAKPKKDVKKEAAKTDAVEKKEAAKTDAVEKKEAAKTDAVEKKEPAKAAAVEKKEPAKADAVEKKEPAKAAAVEKKEPSKAAVVEKKEPAKAAAVDKKDVSPEKPGKVDEEAAAKELADKKPVKAKVRSSAAMAKLEKLLDGKVPEDHEIGLGRKESDLEVEYRTYYLFKEVSLTGDYITDASVRPDPETGQPEVALNFDRVGAKKFGKLTGAHVRERMAIVLEGEVATAPVIQVRIGDGRARITLGATRNYNEALGEANDLAVVLRAGALPAPVRILEERTVGPTMGEDARKQGTLALGLGMILVVIFMVIYYRISGFVADLALIINAVFILAVMAAFEATLTLPGVAGIILTIGMAVDANVIINERVREELRAGKTPRAAVDAGYSRAFWTIFDANFTTLIAAVVLWSYGSGPIQGFAVTLFIGILASMFTAIFVTRLIVDYLTIRVKVNRLSI